MDVPASSQERGRDPGLLERAADPYPSRRAATSAVWPRLDPIIASPDALGPVSRTQLLQYLENGYLRIDDVFGAEEMARLDVAAAQMRTCSSLLRRDEVVRSAVTSEVHTIYRPHGFSEAFAGVLHDARLVAVARQVLGARFYVHQARVNFVSSMAREERVLRSDFETWHVDDGLPRMRAVSVVLSITSTECGPLRLVPGSHRQFVSCGMRRVGLWGRDAVIDEAQLRTIERANGLVVPSLPRGSIMLVDCNLLYAVEAMVVPFSPKIVTVVYNSTDNRPVAPYCGLAPRASYLAEREAIPP